MSVFTDISKFVEKQKFPLLIVGGGILAYIGIRKMQRAGLDNRYGGDVAIQMAAEFDAAMSGAGTDEDALYGLADRINTQDLWTRIAQAYRKQYGEELMTTISGDLNTDELRKFNTRLNNAMGVSTSTPALPKPIRDQIVVSNHAVNIRSTPVVDNSLIISNKVGYVQPNTIIGLATGNMKFDNSTNEPVYFVEVEATFPKTWGTNARYTIWVARSFVDFYPNNTPFNWNKYKIIPQSEVN